MPFEPVVAAAGHVQDDLLQGPPLAVDRGDGHPGADEERVELGGVVAADGQNLSSGNPIIDGTTVTQAVQPGQAGVFTVRWRVVSSDGHPISNEYQYTVEAVAVPTSTPTPEATEEQTPEPSATTPATTSGEMHNGPSGGGELLPVLAVVSGVIVLGGALIVVLMVARERRRRDRAAAAAASGQGSRDGNTGKDGPADAS